MELTNKVRYVPYLIIIAFLLTMIICPLLPDAGIDSISNNLLHISYIKGRVLFSIIIIAYYFFVVKSRPVALKIYSSIFLFLFPILLYFLYHVENPINFIPYSISLYLFNGEGEIYLIALFDVFLVFGLIHLANEYIFSKSKNI